MKLTTFLERRLRALQVIADAPGPLVSLTLPHVRLTGTTNGSQGVTTAGLRGRRERQRGLGSMGRNAGASLKLRALLDQHWALVVRVIRVAPRALDDDNLAATLKRVRDGLAHHLGVDDKHPCVEYVPDADRGAVRENAVRLEVFVAPASAPPPPYRPPPEPRRRLRRSFRPTLNVRKSR
jgi:hypothetical protein